VEKLGKPALPLINPFFIAEAKDVANELGWPHPRIVCPSEPNADRADKATQAIADGNDPVLGKPFIQAIVDALTLPLTAEESRKGKLTHPIEPRYLSVSGSDEELQEYFFENKMTDGLPIVIPTRERVDRMLAGTSHKPDEIVGNFPVGATDNGQREGQDVTVEKVAAVAVMAGAEPKYFPVILALAKVGPPFGSSAQSFTGMAIVSGPIAKEIGMNSGFGCLSPYTKANATIGRAWQLMTRCFAHGEPALTLMGPAGNNYMYNCLTFAEQLDEPLPAGWPSIAVEKGFKPTDSVVTTWSGRGFRQQETGPTPVTAAVTLENVQPGGKGLMLMTSVTQRCLCEDYGFTTKDDFRKYVYEHVLIKIGDWKLRQMVKCFNIPGLELPEVDSGMARYLALPMGRSDPRVAEYLKLPDSEMVPLFYNATDIEIVTCGAGALQVTNGGDFTMRRIINIDDWR
jgi:hypothetical protein